MRQLIGLIFILTINSCSKINSLETYNKIIDSADKIRQLEQVDNEWRVTREVAAKEDLQTLKDVLKRNIKLESKKELTPDNKFEIIKGDKVLGRVLILHPFANFISDELEFGFRLTYGIGMYPAN
jgi:hypothetical protein